MAWAKLRYSRDQVDAAGDTLIDANIDPAKLDAALEVVSNWRSCHAFPLNTFQMSLRRKAASVVGDRALIAQRIKRLPAIHQKLSRLRHLKLSEVQDIGGCRAIVPTVRNVRAVRDLYIDGDLRHELAGC